MPGLSRLATLPERRKTAENRRKRLKLAARGRTAAWRRAAALLRPVGGRQADNAGHCAEAAKPA